MTIDKLSIGASPSRKVTEPWSKIDWRKAARNVYRLQMRIAKARKLGKHGKVKALQWLLTKSHWGLGRSIPKIFLFNHNLKNMIGF